MKIAFVGGGEYGTTNVRGCFGVMVARRRIIVAQVGSLLAQ